MNEEIILKWNRKNDRESIGMLLFIIQIVQKIG